MPMPTIFERLQPAYRTPTRFYNERGKWRGAGTILRDEITDENPAAAEGYLAKEMEAYAGAQAPALAGALQSTREGAIRRGITGGDLGTSYEGDILSAYQKNIAHETGSRALDIYDSSRNRYLDLLSGQRDYETAEAERKRRKRGGLFGALGAVAGGIGGFFLGGPQGAYAGAKAGGSLGTAVGS
jgi:hypothetical protein